MESEHRHAPRYQFIAEAEVTEISSNTNLTAKTSDLSLCGCFLDMLNPLPNGVDVRVRISHKGVTFTILAEWYLSCPTWEWESSSGELRMTS